jgi:Putative transmembrane protein (PGPGW)
MTALFSKDVWVVLGVVSGVLFIGTLIAIPILIVRLPNDYFIKNHRRTWLQNRHPVLRVTAYVIKNLIGCVFLLAGIAMLVLPGQGILTMLIGVSLIDFRGKQKLQRKLIGQPAVLRTINRIRQKFGRKSLVVKRDEC